VTDEQIKELRKVHSGVNGIIWRIFAMPHPADEREPLIRLEWGWTAAMTDDQLRECADDCPMGHDSVVTGLEDAKFLRDELSRLIVQLESGGDNLTSASGGSD
jgi:hypothetical protein